MRATLSRVSKNRANREARSGFNDLLHNVLDKIELEIRLVELPRRTDVVLPEEGSEVRVSGRDGIYFIPIFVLTSCVCVCVCF